MTSPDLPLRVPFGPGFLDVPVPAGWRVRVARPGAVPPLDDLDRAIALAIATPVSALRLRDLATQVADRASRAGRRPRAVVAITDATRACPDERLVPPLLAEMEAGGVGAGDVLILVATGLHRPATAAEQAAKLGPGVRAHSRVANHDAFDAAALADLGQVEVVDAAGDSVLVPAVVNRAVAEADLVVATGIVEPHQYAGLSGGAKTVAIGLGGAETIDATHGIAFLERPGVGLGRLAGNPFAAAIREIGRRAGLAFVVNVVPDTDGRPVAVAAGAPDAVLDALAAVALPLAGAAVRGSADIVIAGVDPAKAANLYQASRAVTYLHFGPAAAARPGGAYVLPAPLQEGAGRGAGERRFLDAFVVGGTPGEVVARLRATGGRAGDARAWLLARLLADAAVVVVGAADPGLVRVFGMQAAPTLAEGLELAAALAARGGSAGHGPEAAPGAERPLDLLVVPNAIRTLVLGESGGAVPR